MLPATAAVCLTLSSIVCADRCAVEMHFAAHDAAGNSFPEIDDPVHLLQAAAAGSASEGSRLLRWDLSKGSPEQGGAAKQLKKGRPAVAAVPSSRCHGRRPASGKQSSLCLAGQAKLFLSEFKQVLSQAGTCC